MGVGLAAFTASRFAAYGPYRCPITTNLKLILHTMKQFQQPKGVRASWSVLDWAVLARRAKFYYDSLCCHTQAHTHSIHSTQLRIKWTCWMELGVEQCRPTARVADRWRRWMAVVAVVW